jgi:hypothetical protein
VEPVFFRAQGRAALGQIIDEGRALPCTGENCRSLTVWFRISHTTFRSRKRGTVTEEIRDVVEQKSANIELCVIRYFL